MRDITTFADELARVDWLVVDANRILWREEIAHLLTPELIDEHRRDPVGRHSPALEKALDFIRSNPVPGALPLVLITIVPGHEWAIAEYPPEGESEPRVREGTYTSRAQAEHDIFVERIRTIEASFGPASPAEPVKQPGGLA
jgi:hypothetical protein